MPKPGFSILVCPDSALLKDEVNKQASSWGAERKAVFWGDEDPSDSFWQSLRQIGLFAEKRIVIVRQADLWSAGVWKALSQALAAPMDSIWLFLCLEVALEKGAFKIPAHIKNTSCFKFADKKGWIWRNEGLTANMESFVAPLAAQMQLQFSPQILNRFCLSVSPDASSIINELHKLQLLAPDGKVTENILPESSLTLENDAFALLNKLWAGDISGVWGELAKDTEGNLLFFVIALLSREFRLLWQILAGENPRIHPAQAQAKKKLANQLGFAGVAKGFSALADAELQVKTGLLLPPEALEALIINILRLTSPSALAATS